MSAGERVTTRPLAACGAGRRAIEFFLDCRSLSTARYRLEGWLKNVGLPQALRMDVLIAASELLTNACEHGDGSPISVSLRCGSGNAVLTVANGVEGDPVGPPSTWVLPEPLATSGRGLGIVAAVAASIDVDTSGEQLTITATFG